MTIRRFILTMALACAVAGCAGGSVSVLQGGSNPFVQVANPITTADAAAVEAAYGTVLAAAVNYKRLPLCKPGKTELEGLCSRRDVIVQLQAADRKAYAAIASLRNFRKNYPNISAVSALDAARNAVRDFQNVSFINGVK